MTLLQRIEEAKKGITILSRNEEYSMVQVEVIKDLRIMKITDESDYLSLEDLNADDWMVVMFREWAE